MSAVRLDLALLPGMIAQNRGVIIHITSGQARLPGAASLPYAAAKAATTVYSKGLANEVGKHGIRVNTVVPGLIQTPAVTRRLDQITADSGQDAETARQQLIHRVGYPARAPRPARRRRRTCRVPLLRPRGVPHRQPVRRRRRQYSDGLAGEKFLIGSWSGLRSVCRHVARCRITDPGT